MSLCNATKQELVALGLSVLKDCPVAGCGFPVARHRDENAPIPQPGATITAAPEVLFEDITIENSDEYDGSADIYDVKNVRISGLVDISTNVSSMRLFMRNEVKDLWRGLKECPHNARVFVQGCPGVGKSMIVFAQTMEHCINNRQSLLFYHKDSSDETCFVMDGDGQVCIVKAPENTLPTTSTTTSEVLKFVFLQRHKCDITIVDGTHEEIILKELFRNFPSNKKIIICTSYQVNIVNDEAAAKLKKKLKLFTVLSWSLEDYFAAAKARFFQFLEEQETVSTPKAGEEEETESESEAHLETIIRKRFFLCGGSIRYFCGDEDDSRRFIDAAIKRISDYTSLFKNKVGEKSEFAVNTVMALYHEGNEIYSVPLSGYVFKKLADKCREDNSDWNLISLARLALPNNPSWQGWVTEYEVLLILKVHKQLSVHSKANGIATSTLSSTNFIELQEDESSSLSLKEMSNYEPNTWIIPNKWNQALWDALQILDKGILGVRQITSGETHTNKLKHLISLTDIMMPASSGPKKIKKVHFLTICRKSNFEKLKLLNIDEEELSSKGIQVTFQKVWYDEGCPTAVSTTEPAQKKRRLN